MGFHIRIASKCMDMARSSLQNMVLFIIIIIIIIIIMPWIRHAKLHVAQRDWKLQAGRDEKEAQTNIQLQRWFAAIPIRPVGCWLPTYSPKDGPAIPMRPQLGLQYADMPPITTNTYIKLSDMEDLPPCVKTRTAEHGMSWYALMFVQRF